MKANVNVEKIVTRSVESAVRRIVNKNIREYLAQGHTLSEAVLLTLAKLEVHSHGENHSQTTVKTVESINA